MAAQRGGHRVLMSNDVCETCVMRTTDPRICHHSLKVQ